MNAVSWKHDIAMAGCLLVLATLANGESPVLERGSEATLQTAEGMILFGTIVDASEPGVTLETVYGRLTLPLDRIARVDGDRFDAGRGIIREHSVEISANGDVILEYMIPIAKHAQGTALNLLVPGSIRQVLDVDGNPLPFVASHAGRHSRCTVTCPEYLLPAVVVRTRIENGAKVEDRRISYSYRYTPRSNQTFRLTLNLPGDIASFVAKPPAVRAATNTVMWEEPLQRQDTKVFEITFTLAE